MHHEDEFKSTDPHLNLDLGNEKFSHTDWWVKCKLQTRITMRRIHKPLLRLRTWTLHRSESTTTNSDRNESQASWTNLSVMRDTVNILKKYLAVLTEAPISRFCRMSYLSAWCTRDTLATILRSSLWLQSTGIIKSLAGNVWPKRTCRSCHVMASQLSYIWGQTHS